MSSVLQRLREYRRTSWQLAGVSRAGVGGVRLATEVIASKECLQRKWELVTLMGLVRRLAPRTVIEIGTYKGGTLRCWSYLCGPTTTFVSIDLPGGAFGGGSTEEESEAFHRFLKPGQTLHRLRGDSHDPEVRGQVESLLKGAPVDFLFIDGDHSYEGVKLDFEMYSSFVRPDGLIAFHDIVPHVVHKSCQVHRYWEELRGAPDAREIIDRDGFDNWGGIGVLLKGRGPA